MTRGTGGRGGPGAAILVALGLLAGLAALFLALAWAILALVYYSVRDRR